MQIKGKIAIITGSSSGFGKALSEKLVSLGAKVVCGDISVDAGQEAVKHLNQKAPGSAVFCPCNVTKKADIVNLFEAAKKSFGGTVDVDFLM